MESLARTRNAIRWGIFHQILAGTLVVALAPIAVIWLLGVYPTQQALSASVSRNLLTSADAIAGRVEHWMSMNQRLLEQNAKTPAMRSMDRDAQTPVLKTISDAYPWIYLAFSVLPDGKNLGRSDDKPPAFYGDRAYFQKAIGGASIGRQVVLGKSSNKPALIIAKAIEGLTGEPIGVLAIAMTLEDLSATVAQSRIGKTGYALLLDEDNRLIANGEGSVASELQDFGGHPALAHLPGANEPILIQDEDGRQLICYVKVLDQGWKLIVQQDSDEAYASASSAKTAGLIALAVSLLLAVAFVLVMTTRLRRQLGGEPATARAMMEQVAQGDLRIELGNPPTDSLLASLRTMVEALRGLVGETNAEAQALASSVESIHNASHEVSASSVRESEATASMASAIEQLTLSSTHISEIARDTEADSRRAMTLCSEGRTRVDRASQAIQAIATTVTEASSRMSALESRADQISAILEVIKTIAAQTNLLALNAAIEAARAGEQGRGFAVVADEVRGLAGRASGAAKEIEHMIAGMQGETRAAVEAMNRVLPEVDSGVGLAQSASSALDAIEAGARATLARVHEVAEATHEQANASTSLARHVDDIAQMAQETTRAVLATARDARQLEGIAQNMKQQISRFHL